MGVPAQYTASQLATIKATVAKEATPAEFDQFLAACRSYGLDPFRGQIALTIYNKTNASKRSHAIIVQRDGLRTIAQRCGDYRPASGPARFETDPDLKSETNPHGIISCSVTLHKQDRNGDWYDVWGEAYWDEFAPVTEEWAYNDQEGRRTPTGKKTLSGSWAKMPRLMIQKCAEAQALRAGWPDQFGGLYVEEEMAAANVEEEMRDITPTQHLEQYERDKRKAALGGPSIMFSMDPKESLEAVSVGKVFDRVMAFLKDATPEDVAVWRDRNQQPLRQYWSEAPADALSLKAEIEKKIATQTP